jgi:chromosome segregation ATPase
MGQMHDDDRPDDVSAAGDDLGARLDALDRKLDTIAGAMAAVASTQTDLLARTAEGEAHRSEDALDLAQRLDALERQVLTLSQQGPSSAPGGEGRDDVLGPLAERVTELAEAATGQRDDLALALDVLARMAEALERSDARTEDRLAAVRDAASVPVADLQALIAARADRSEARMEELVGAVESALDAIERSVPSGDAGPTEGSRVGAAADRITERVDELGEVVKSLSWQLPEISEELGALRERVESVDVAGPVASASEELGGRLTHHTDAALAGVLRLLDERLTSLRQTIVDAVSTQQPAAGQGSMGFEAGAVMGAAQAAWNRLEQRLDSEFDDLGRQLQSMGTIIEQALATAEAAANRPVVTGEQLRRAASSVKDSVLSASRSRRDRRGGPRGLGPGSS